MAVSGTVPSSQPKRLAPTDIARWIRRVTLVLGVTAITWFFLQFGTRWVPKGMYTVPDMPPGSWLILDRWCTGLRVGSDVFVETPDGEVLSRVSDLTDDEVFITHPSPGSSIGDSSKFGGLPRKNVRAVVVVVFPPE